MSTNQHPNELRAPQPKLDRFDWQQKHQVMHQIQIYLPNRQGQNAFLVPDGKNLMLVSDLSGNDRNRRRGNLHLGKIEKFYAPTYALEIVVIH